MEFPFSQKFKKTNGKMEIKVFKIEPDNPLKTNSGTPSPPRGVCRSSTTQPTLKRLTHFFRKCNKNSLKLSMIKNPNAPTLKKMSNFCDSLMTVFDK